MVEPAIVYLDITHSVQTRRAQEVKFNRASTITDVKNQLYTLFGTEPHHQELVLRDSTGSDLAALTNDAAILNSYNPTDHSIIHIKDSNPDSIDFNNVDEVEKYEISEEAYAARPDSFRNFKKAQTAGQAPPVKKDNSELGAEEAAQITVGSRCSVSPGDKRGSVAYVGKVPEASPGWWVGVSLDEPMGKNDGSVKGVRYFECGQNFGTFARPNNVTVGDFQPFDEI